MEDLTPDELRELARKWLKGELAPEEQARLDAWYARGLPESLDWPSAGEEALRERLFAQTTARTQVAKVRPTRRWAGWAAGAILLLAGTLWYSSQQPFPQLTGDVSPGSKTLSLKQGRGRSSRCKTPTAAN